MQKVTKFLEDYIQWVALTLGAIWMFFMAYSYWGGNPVTADINGGKVAPGDIEDRIHETPAIDGLEKAKANQGNYPKSIKDALTARDHIDYTEEFIAAIATGGGAFPPAAPSPFAGALVQGPTQSNKQDAGNTAALLPQTAGIIALETNASGDAGQPGMSVVKRPDPNVPYVPNAPQGQQEVLQPPDPNANNPAAVNANAGQPGQPIAPPPPTPIVVVPEEVTWVTVAGTLDMKKLAAAFQQANIPAAAAFTSILRVELIRQELSPKGDWTGETVIKDLTNQFKPAMPQAPADQVVYLQWAQQHVADIVQPPFYEVLRGQLWKTVVMQEVADAGAAQQVADFHPENVKPGEVLKLTPEQRAQWLEWKKQQEAQQKTQRTPRPAPSSGGGGGMRSPQFFSPPFYGDSPIMPRGGHDQRFTPPPTAAASPAPVATGAPPQPQQPQELPTSPFSPAQQVKDLEIWAHDETTIPGKVYRYKLRIWIKNPLWATQQMAKNPADADVFALSAETDWSKPINSPSKQDFFVSNGGSTVGGVPKIGIDYFKWDDGSWKQTYVTLQPGDRVGETRWTVVDLRPIGNSAGDNRVMLVSDTGDIISRFYKLDKVDPRYAKLKTLVRPGGSLPAGSPAAATPGAPAASASPGVNPVTGAPTMR